MGANPLQLPKQNLELVVDNQKQVEVKKQPTCARCHKDKKTRKHHFPLGSNRMALLCNHCYGVVKKQRARAAKWGRV
jgi:late competence protein required for DNA uptake (superfamily II DNA/RNA helicase)